MPTYEYKCDACGHQFEEFQRITAPPLEICPKCGGKVRRLISPGNGIIFKGSGFYITDYKRSGSHSSDGGTTSVSTSEKSDDTSSSKETKKKDKTSDDK